MPITLAPNDIIQVTVWCQMLQQASLNVLHYAVLNAVGGIALEDLSNDFYDTFKSNWSDMMTNLAEIQGTIIQRIKPVASARVLSTNPAVPGAGTGNPEGAQVSAIVTKLTALPGRKYRGRAYIGFLPEEAEADGFNLTNAWKTKADAVATTLSGQQTFIHGAMNVELIPVIYDRKAGTYQPITSCKARTYLCTQRRRGGSGRPNVSPF